MTNTMRDASFERQLTEQEFIDRFRPAPNTLDENASFNFGEGGCGLSWHGEELAAIRAADPARIWTALECDGRLCLLSGYHHVDRLGYVLCGVSVRGGESFLVNLDD